MTKHQLAQELRARQYAYGEVEPHIGTFFPKTSRNNLVRQARLHAIELENYETPDERAVVNYLRHEFTDYDDEPSQVRHRAACEAIAAQYPWLAEECARQIKRRAQQEAEEAAMLRAYEAEQARAQAERRAVVEASKKMITSLTVGQRVLYKYKRWEYEATISKIGRSKITVTYRLKTSGDQRVKEVHAALVTALASDTTRQEGAGGN
jgi:hypothetical protein